jgi:hypothetical protein
MSFKLHAQVSDLGVSGVNAHRRVFVLIEFHYWRALHSE